MLGLGDFVHTPVAKLSLGIHSVLRSWPTTAWRSTRWRVREKQIFTDYLQRGELLGSMGAISLFTLLLAAITTIRMSRSAATMKCLYLLATGIGRSRYART